MNGKVTINGATLIAWDAYNYCDEKTGRMYLIADSGNGWTVSEVINSDPIGSLVLVPVDHWHELPDAVQGARADAARCLAHHCKTHASRYGCDCEHCRPGHPAPIQGRR